MIGNGIGAIDQANQRQELFALLVFTIENDVKVAFFDCDVIEKDGSIRLGL